MLTFTNSQTAQFTENGTAGTIAFSPAQNLAPLSLAGNTISVGAGRTLSFGYDTFASTGGAGAGVYTYAAYGPTVGMVQWTYTDSQHSGSEYLQLTFSTMNAGTFYSTGIDASGKISITTGDFTLQ
jgi:hypothetical protein